jgi:protoheme IX farnesyltransferase
VTAVEPGNVVRRDPSRAARTPGQTLRAYVALTKPRIIELLLVTTIPTMILAADGLPPLWTVLATLLGGTLAAAGANTLNSWFDRDIDVLMVRTGRRPLATGEVTPREAVVFGLLLSAASVAFLWLTVNPLSAWLALGAIAFYVLVYTMGLKRRTSQNIVWGGAAGCFPVLIGWAAVTDSLAWTPFVLFLVVFFWTPPHCWRCPCASSTTTPQQVCRCCPWSRPRRKSRCRSCCTRG